MAISYMVVIKKKQKDQNQIFEEYEKTKIGLFNDLNQVFRNDAKRWSLKLDKDLSIKFTNPQVLFDDGSSVIKPDFIIILSDFLPKYLGVVMQEKYRDKIAEIRIEGHTNTIPIKQNSDPYLDNMDLSQDRARNVLAFLRSQKCFLELEPERQTRLQYWLTANGLSYGRTVDLNDTLSFFSGKQIDNNKSRRVEFRIVTSSDDIINKAIENIKSKEK
jgi:outer membrane protein OmpA-like peptidoglycan-associated protein